jgi:hypothetical protein
MAPRCPGMCVTWLRYGFPTAQHSATVVTRAWRSEPGAPHNRVTRFQTPGSSLPGFGVRTHCEVHSHPIPAHPIPAHRVLGAGNHCGLPVTTSSDEVQTLLRVWTQALSHRMTFLGSNEVRSC